MDQLTAPLVISGPSGVGKGTVINALLRQRPETHLAVSATTRSARPGERDGIDYRFLSLDEFSDLRDDGQFLEWAQYAGNTYGTLIGELSAASSVIIECDVDGARQIQAAQIGARLIFLDAPSHAELERRLRSRGTESESQVQRRLDRAEHERAAAKDLGAEIVVNHDVSKTLARLLDLLDDIAAHDLELPAGAS
jgi:guanylate kinase